MSSRVSENPDCWYGVQDAAERKKIQNRIAQRVRRRRTASLKQPTRPNTSTNAPSTSTLTMQEPTLNSPRIERNSPYSTMSTLQLTPSSPSTSEPFTTEIPPSVFAALWDNGVMLGLTCGTVIPARSHPVGPEIPLSLHPTLLQLTTIHATWIDRFPLPKMRDALITLSGFWDEEEFLKDLFSMDSFTIKADKAGWDPGAWAVTPAFRGKWGFLFT